MTLKKVKPKTSSKKDEIIKAVKKGAKAVEVATEAVKKAKPQVVKKAKSYIDDAEKTVKKFSFKKFIADILNVILNPVKHFQMIKEDGNYKDAIANIFLYGIILGCIKILFSVTSISLIGSIISLLIMPIYAMFLAFALSGILLLFSYFTKGKMSFEIALKSVSAAIFMYPLSYIAYKISFTFFILVLLSVLLDLYVLFLIYTATTTSLNSNTKLAALVFSVFAILMVALNFNAKNTLYLSIKNYHVAYNHEIHKILTQSKQNINNINDMIVKEGRNVMKK